jgi:transcription antitermination factor NusG
MIRRIRAWRCLLLLIAALVDPYRGLCLLTSAFAPSSIVGTWTQRRTISAAPVPYGPSSSATTESTSLVNVRARDPALMRLRATLWDRMELDDDDAPLWYLLNCVAGNEIDLLRQCRMACSDFGSSDVAKFVVPTVRSVRSHGANRMVTDVKVRYPGYVFAKVRLCQRVYETVQSLDLCRSWMGTVNQRGYKKLPPAPLALNEDEIAKFGLEKVDDDGNDVGVEVSDGTGANENGDSNDENDDGIIVDTAERDEIDSAKAIGPKELKVYQGLKVEDMVKVTAQNKFWNEDGIVRRLKDGKILVRFYTYGSTYEEWLQPGDVRRLSSMEILRGLAGPSQPVTQRDFDDDNSSSGSNNSRYGGGGAPGNNRGDRRSNDSPFQPAFGGQNAAQPPQRNRRQDRTESRFRNDRDSDSDERRRDERNWNWYQDQQQQQQQQQNQDRRRPNAFSPSGQDQQQNQDRRRPNAFSPSGRGDSDASGAAALRDVDSQWGRSNDRMSSPPPRRQQQQQQQPPPPRQPGRESNRFENRRVQSAIDGRGDWGAFVSRKPQSTSASPDEGPDRIRSREGTSSDQPKTGRPNKSSDGSLDDFFDTLMDGLSKDLGGDSRSSADRGRPGNTRYSGGPARNDSDGPSADPRRRPDRSAPVAGPSKSDKDSDDAFFASLMTELQASVDDTSSTADARASSSNRRADPVRGSNHDEDSDTVFDSFLSSFGEDGIDAQPAKDKPKARQPASSPSDRTSTSFDDDDFFASLAAELDADTSSATPTTTARGDDIVVDSASTKASDTEVADGAADKSTTRKSAKKEGAPANAGGAAAGAGLDKLTIPALKEMLKERGLKVTGKKAELIERLSS